MQFQQNVPINVKIVSFCNKMTVIFFVRCFILRPLMQALLLYQYNDMDKNNKAFIHFKLEEPNYIA